MAEGRGGRTDAQPGDAVPLVDRPVLQLLGPSTGGIRRHVAALTLALRDRGWRVATAGPAGVLDGLGVDLDHVVPVPGGSDVRRAAAALTALRNVAADARLVHAHGLRAGWLAALVRPRRPVVVTVHNLVLDEAAGRSAAVLRRLEGVLPGRVDAVIAVSHGIADRFADAPPGRVTIIRPLGPPPHPQRTPAEVRDRLGVPPGAPLVVCVARLHPQKGLTTLVDASALLRDLVPGVCVAVVGAGPDEQALRGRIARLGLAGTVLLAGASPNAPDELAAADTVVCSSVWESGPLAVAEALALGRPVVSTPVGFVPELVVDGWSGRLVPVGSADALADAVAAVLTEPETAAGYGEHGRARVTDVLGPDRLVAAVEAVYRQVLR